MTAQEALELARARLASLEADPSNYKPEFRTAFRGGFAQCRKTAQRLLNEMLAELETPDLQASKYDPWTWEAPDGTEHEAIGPVCPIRYSRGRMRPLMGDDGPIVDLPVWSYPIRRTGKKT